MRDIEENEDEKDKTGILDFLNKYKVLIMLGILIVGLFSVFGVPLYHHIWDKPILEVEPFQYNDTLYFEIYNSTI